MFWAYLGKKKLEQQQQQQKSIKLQKISFHSDHGKYLK